MPDLYFGFRLRFGLCEECKYCLLLDIDEKTVFPIERRNRAFVPRATELLCHASTDPIDAAVFELRLRDARRARPRRAKPQYLLHILTPPISEGSCIAQQLDVALVMSPVRGVGRPTTEIQRRLLQTRGELHDF